MVNIGNSVKNFQNLIMDKQTYETLKSLGFTFLNYFPEKSTLEPDIFEIKYWRCSNIIKFQKHYELHHIFDAFCKTFYEQAKSETYSLGVDQGKYAMKQEFKKLFDIKEDE